MAGVRLEFAQFGHFDYFNIYRNSVSTAIENLGQPIGTSSTMYYEDLNVEPNRDYYYRVGVIRDSIEEFSEEVHIRAEVVFDPPYNLIVEFKNDEVNRLELNWNLDGFVDEQRYYCSETPIDTANLPVPKAVLAGDVRAYVDTDVEIGKTYYVRVGSVKNDVEKLSDEKVVRAGGDEYWSSVVSLLRFENGIVDDTGRVWNIVGNPVVQNGALVLNGSSGLTTSAAGFNFGTADFTIEAFVKQTPPNNLWRELFMANSSGGINVMLYDRKLAASRESIANDYVSAQETSQNELKHIAISRNSGVLRGFIGGSKVIEGSWLHSFSSSALHSLGSKTDGTSGLVGSIDQFRVTNGVGRYTSDFTPQDFSKFLAPSGAFLLPKFRGGAMSNATQIVDASGPAATGAGAGITLLSWITTWDLGFLIGVLIGLAGVAIQFANYRTNKQFQKQKDQREQAEDRRKQELHEINMRKALEQCNAEQD